MGTVNLGRVRDRVTGVERINGNGSAGTIDTYRVSFESSNYYDFNVTNGRNGVGQIVSFSGDSDSRNNLIVRIVDNQDKVLALLLRSDSNSEVNDGYMQASFKVEKTAESTGGLVTTSDYDVYAYDLTGSQLFKATCRLSNLAPVPLIVTFTFSSGTEACLDAWCLLYYNDSSTGITVDDELSDNSTNPVQNKVVTAALDLKQDTLVSGENIKTINGTSLVGSGNYDFDTAFDETSTNAVQNKVLTEYITDLESKVSTLAVKVYNHDIALGTLNIENTLYSVENADSFAIPTTIGTNADVVIPKSRMALSAIKGKTEYSRNLMITIQEVNGYSVSSGDTAVLSDYNKSLKLSSGEYYISFNSNITDGSVTYGVCYSEDGSTWNTRDFAIAGKSNTGFAFTLDRSCYVSLRLYGATTGGNVTISNIMLVKGSTAPTSFVPYYTGLKNVELNSLNVYGKTDNYTELRVGDEVTCLYLTDLSSVTTSLNVSINLDDVPLYISPSWKVNGYQYDKADEVLAWTGSAYGETQGHAMLEGGGFLYLRKPRKVTAKYGSATDVNNVKNATSVKSILPSSILPKTLASYERLEVVDNGDDTYKVDLVSHAELHVGDEINSLWVGNPQGGNYNSNSVFLYIGGVEIYNPSYASDIFNRMFTQSLTYISNKNDFYLLWRTALIMGGDDIYVDGEATNRNITIKFTEPLSVTHMPVNNKDFTTNFRNGEETRTTLIDGLSLDDVSAVIDTGDIVYADNSNAKYDVNIAETSVELLVNKN